MLPENNYHSLPHAKSPINYVEGRASMKKTARIFFAEEFSMHTHIYASHVVYNSYQDVEYSF